MKYTKHILSAILLGAMLVSCGAPSATEIEAGTTQATTTTIASQTLHITEATTEADTATVTDILPPAQTDETEAERDEFDYSTLTLPDYRAENPVRYLDVDERGAKYNGWQDFGKTGELRTMPMPQSTYTYQMYSWFIRNDLTHLYPGQALPDDPAALAAWLAEYRMDARSSLWYSMTVEKPQAVEQIADGELLLTNGILRARYRVTEKSGTTRDWALYILCEDGTASVLALRINESPDTVLSVADGIATSYRQKAAD